MTGWSRTTAVNRGKRQQKTVTSLVRTIELNSPELVKRRALKLELEICCHAQREAVDLDRELFCSYQEENKALNSFVESI